MRQFGQNALHVKEPGKAYNVSGVANDQAWGLIGPNNMPHAFIGQNVLCFQEPGKAYNVSGCVNDQAWGSIMLSASIEHPV